MATDGADPHAKTLAGVDLSPAPREPVGAERYESRAELGKGGMGEVGLYHDRRIGREVALKRMQPGHRNDAGLTARFLREARIQGQLAHPAIVPVYDLDTDTSGDGYFTMQRVHGVTLAHTVEGLRRADPTVKQRFSRRRLLEAFARVCLAIDFAHARGVLHRDLKPANVMLGEYGEVHVLDWGVARVVSVEGEGGAPGSAPSASEAGGTQAGVVLGTPGYMAPEQVRGENQLLDGRADVYALGAILFELLTLAPLHVGSSVAELTASTLEGNRADARERLEAAAAPPELAAICLKATDVDPAARFASAREVAESIERFLDGDRDLERRRQLADEHARVAARILERRELGTAERTRAIREVGAAMALDVAHPEARRALVRLLTEPPSEVPPEAQAEINRLDEETLRVGGRTGALIHVGWLSYAIAFVWMGVKSGLAFGLYLGSFGAALAICLAIGAGAPPRRLTQLLVLVNVIGVGVACTAFGPFMLAQPGALGLAMAWMMHPRGVNRVAIMVLLALSTLVPAMVNWLAIGPQSYQFRDGVMVVTPVMIELPMHLTHLVLGVGGALSLVAGALYMKRTRDQLGRAERALQLQAWQLRQLFPG